MQRCFDAVHNISTGELQDIFEKSFAGGTIKTRARMGPDRGCAGLKQKKDLRIGDPFFSVFRVKSRRCVMVGDGEGLGAQVEMLSITIKAYHKW